MVDTSRVQQSPSGPDRVREVERGGWLRGLGRRGSGLAWGLALWLAVLVAVTCAHARPGEQVLHHEQTEHYGIWVIEREGLRVLRFERDGVDQSAVKLDDPTYLEFTYTRTAMAVFGLVPEARRVLVVGLGGGSIPMFLRAVAPEIEVDVVEIDPAVARVAEAHLGLRPGPQLRVHIADGRRFIEEATGTWDVILLDAYGPDAIPRHLATREFLAAVRARLSPGGVVAANLWAERVNPLYPSMLRTYEAVFPEVHVVRGIYGSSRIVMAPREAAGWDAARVRGGVDALATRWQLHFDLRRMVALGYDPPGEHPSGGEVLRDR